MIALLHMLFAAPDAAVIFLKVDERLGFQIERLDVSDPMNQARRVTVFVSTDVRYNFRNPFLTLSPSGRFFCVEGHDLRNRRSKVWIVESRSLEVVDEYAFSTFAGVPYWTSDRELVLHDNVVVNDNPELEWTPVFTVSPHGKLVLETRRAVKRPPNARNGQVGESVMDQLKYRWPLEVGNSRPDFGAAQFNNRRGHAVISPDGSTILTSVEDAMSPTKARSILLERKGKAWVEHRLGDHSLPVFTLFDGFFSIYDEVQKCAVLYSKSTRREVARVRCDAYDLGPLIRQ